MNVTERDECKDIISEHAWKAEENEDSDKSLLVINHCIILQLQCS